jgi:hypothetical protein
LLLQLSLRPEPAIYILYSSKVEAILERKEKIGEGTSQNFKSRFKAEHSPSMKIVDDI